MSIDTALIFDDQVVWPWVVYIGVFNVQCGQIAIFTWILQHFVNMISLWNWMMDILDVNKTQKRNSINYRKMHFSRLILYWVLNVPYWAPASNRNDPHSHATWRGRGSAQTVNVSVAFSPLRTDIKCDDGFVRNTCGAPTQFFML